MTLKEKIDLIFNRCLNETLREMKFSTSVVDTFVKWERTEGSPFYRPLEFYKPYLKRNQIKKNSSLIKDFCLWLF